MATFELLETLCNTPGVVGNETKVGDLVFEELSRVCDSVQKDRLGSVIGELSGSRDNLRVMMAGHMDEVGYMIDYIHEDGYLDYHGCGGWDPCQQLGQRVLIHTRHEGSVLGVICVKNRTSDDWKTPLDAAKLYIDIGAFSRREAEGFGVRVGDFVSAESKLTRLNNPDMLLSKAFDCRAGVGVMLEAMKALKTSDHPNIVFGAGTVQEEVGCRGARTAARLVRPDVFIALDTGAAGDLPGDPKNRPDRGLSKGPGIVVMDRGMISPLKLRNWLIDLAEEMNIPHQVSYMDGGSFDSSTVHISGIGVPSIPVTIPARYVHTTGSIIHWADYKNAIDLVVAMVRKLDRTTFESLLP